MLCGDDDGSCGGGDANLIGPLHMCQASNQRSDEGAGASNTKQAQTRIQTRKHYPILRYKSSTLILCKELSSTIFAL